MLGPALSGRPAPAVNPRNPADFGFWLHLPLLRRCQLVGTSWQAAPAPPPPCPACGSGLTMVLKMRQVRPGKPRETPGRVVWWWLSLTFSGVVVVFVLMPCRVTVDPPPQTPPCRFIAVAWQALVCSVCEHWCSLEDLGSAAALPSSKPPRTLALYSPRPLSIFLSYGHDGFTSVRTCAPHPHMMCANHAYLLVDCAQGRLV